MDEPFRTVNSGVELVYFYLETVVIPSVDDLSSLEDAERGPMGDLGPAGGVYCTAGWGGNGALS